jgi:hypothetical protein
VLDHWLCHALLHGSGESLRHTLLHVMAGTESFCNATHWHGHGHHFCHGMSAFRMLSARFTLKRYAQNSMHTSPTADPEGHDDGMHASPSMHCCMKELSLNRDKNQQ